MVQRQDLIDPEVFRQTAVSIRGALSILLPQHEVSVLARARDELCGVRDRDGMHLIGVTAQHLCLGPVVRIPEADGLITPRRDQTSSVASKRQLANPTGV